MKGRNEAPSPGRWWGGRAQATGAGPGLQAWLQALPSGAWGLPRDPSVDWQSWRGSLPRPGGSTCGCPPGGHCPRGTGGTATSEHFGSVGRGLLSGRPRGVAGVGVATRQRTPRGARVWEMRPPPVHLGAGDPAGRAEVGGTPAPRPPLLPPPALPRPRSGPAPAGPAPPPAPGGPAWPGPARPPPPHAGSAPPAGFPGRAGPHRGGVAAGRAPGLGAPLFGAAVAVATAAAATGAGAAASAAAAASTARGTLSL